MMIGSPCPGSCTHSGLIITHLACVADRKVVAQLRSNTLAEGGTLGGTHVGSGGEHCADHDLVVWLGAATMLDYWAIGRWDDGAMGRSGGRLADQPPPLRWGARCAAVLLCGRGLPLHDGGRRGSGRSRRRARRAGGRADRGGRARADHRQRGVNRQPGRRSVLSAPPASPPPAKQTEGAVAPPPIRPAPLKGPVRCAACTPCAMGRSLMTALAVSRMDVYHAGPAAEQLPRPGASCWCASPLRCAHSRRQPPRPTPTMPTPVPVPTC